MLAPLLFILLFFCFSAQADIGVYMDTRAENYSEAFVLKNNKPSYAQSGELLYSHLRFEAGIQWHGFSIGYLDRFDAIAHFSNEAAQLYAQSKDKTKAIDEQRFHVKLSANRVRGKGFTLGYQGTFRETEYGLSMDITETSLLLYGDLEGHMDFKDEELSGDATLDYYYDRDLVYSRRNSKPSGTGLGVSLMIAQQFRHSYHRLMIKDAFYQAYWERAPHTTAVMNTNRIGGEDENGKFIIRPLGSGTESYRKFRQKLPARYYSHHAFHFTPIISGLIELDYLAERFWPRLGIQYRLGVQTLQVLYGLNDKSFGFNHRLGKYFGYHLQLDHNDYEKAHRINVGFRVFIGG